MTSTEIYYFMDYRLKKRSLKILEDLRKASEEEDDDVDAMPAPSEDAAALNHSEFAEAPSKIEATAKTKAAVNLETAAMPESMEEELKSELGEDAEIPITGEVLYEEVFSVNGGAKDGDDDAAESFVEAREVDAYVDQIGGDSDDDLFQSLSENDEIELPMLHPVPEANSV